MKQKHHLHKARLALKVSEEAGANEQETREIRAAILELIEILESKEKVGA